MEVLMLKKMRIAAMALIAFLAIGTIGSVGMAQTLRIGMFSKPSSMDPHYHNLGPNNAMARHIFDRLVHTDKNIRHDPGLAVSWKTLDDTTWEFKLRRGVKFHDGSDFTAADVLYTFQRAPNVPNSPSSFGIYTKQIKSATAPDPYTLIIKTAKPYPLMPNDLSQINIMSRNSKGKTTTQLNKGDGLNGTGPFKFVEWVREDRVVLERNENYWGEKPAWKRVIFKPITNHPARVAALLAGDVDMIDQVPTADIERLKKDKKLVLSQGVSSRVIYLHLDHDRDDSPMVTGTGGKNPLRDRRVRLAISKAINRPAIVSKVMEGVAIAAGQLLPKGFFGWNPKLKPEKFDPEGAKRLLREAGYPNGFGLTIHGPNNRYINDAKICQAIAQMLTRVGIKTKVVTMPKSVFFSNATKRLYSFILVGWGSGTGESSSPLRALLATHNRATGMGLTNRGRFSNAEMDRLLSEALSTVNDAKREKLLQDATAIAMRELGIIPLHYQVNTWAVRKGLWYEPRADEATLVMSLKKR